ncbi:hypothetical protein M9H77_03095 [Catharanthus roseus]|uniref:Uncharacterized protein n=1 Tax=Catharanthus roseus TaxID=4058 RepID=A0ACC0CAJ3_CATRO|nr:hypothetical protein M9H77_03095 [Catharanthus roseus]
MAPRSLVKKEPLQAWILRAFTGSETDDDFILRRSWIYFFTSSQSYASRFFMEFGLCALPQDAPALAVEVLSYPNDEYIRWHREITRVYIRNSANRDTRSVGYQLAGVDRRMMEVDDMASVVIQEPPSSPS